LEIAVKLIATRISLLLYFSSGKSKTSAFSVSFVEALCYATFAERCVRLVPFARLIGRWDSAVDSDFLYQLNPPRFTCPKGSQLNEPKVYHLDYTSIDTLRST